MQEQEYWGELSAVKFQALLTSLTKKYGQPRLDRRLAIKMVSAANHQLDTRLKITNGKVQLVQKFGDWDSPVREEYSYDLPADAKALLGVYQVINNLLPTDRQLVLIQHENYLFKADKAEIKLSKQFGQKQVYCFEIEGDDLQQLDQICQELGLKPVMYEQRRQILNKWNQQVNLDADKLSETALIALFEQYLS